jgi:hypothetical protein
MAHLSVRISDQLLERVIERGMQIGVDNVRDAVRILLLWALENQNLDPNNTLSHQMISYVIKVHCMVEEAYLALVEEGEKIKNKAHVKAEKLIDDLRKEHSE